MLFLLTPPSAVPFHSSLSCCFFSLPPQLFLFTPPSAVIFHSSLSCSFSHLPQLFLFTPPSLAGLLHSFFVSLLPLYSCSFLCLPLKLSLFIPPPLPFEYSFSHFLLESIFFTFPPSAVPFHSSLSRSFTLLPQLFLIIPPPAVPFHSSLSCSFPLLFLQLFLVTLSSSHSSHFSWSFSRILL